MGINKHSFLLNLTKESNPKDFFLSQAHWGHTKSRLNSFMNIYTLGFRNNSSILNPYFSQEYFKRCLFFCSKIILDGGNLLFTNNGSSYHRFVLFFSFRSLQFLYYGKWSYGNYIKNFFKNFSILLVPNLDELSLLLKESLKKLTPVISVEDSDHKSLKPFFSFLGNDNSKVSICYFYTCLSNCILKSLLFNYSTLLK